MRFSAAAVLFLASSLNGAAYGTLYDAEGNEVVLPEGMTVYSDGYESWKESYLASQTSNNDQRRLDRFNLLCSEIVSVEETDGAITESSVGCPSDHDDPTTFNFHRVNLEAGVTYTIEVDRIDCNMDPIMQIYSGDDGCPATDPGIRLILGDDEDDPDPSCGEQPLFADPKADFTPSVTGTFLIGVSDFNTLNPGSFDTDSEKVGIEDACPPNRKFAYLLKISPDPVPFPKNGAIVDDPHIMTWNNTWFDYHGACDLVLLDAPNFQKDESLTLQVRTTIRYFYSFISAAALKIGDDTLEVNSWGGYALNGVDHADLTTVGGFQIHYKQVSDKQHVFDIIVGSEDHERITISTFKDMVSVKIHEGSYQHFGESTGIMGSFDGTMKARNGTAMLWAADEGDPNAFGAEWQVRDDEPMLFRLARPPQFPEKCQLPTMEQADMRRRRLGESVARAAAERACAKYIHDNDPTLEACIYDVLATGDLEMARPGAF